jgi:hypothetical protein
MYYQTLYIAIILLTVWTHNFRVIWKYRCICIKQGYWPRLLSMSDKGSGCLMTSLNLTREFSVVVNDGQESIQLNGVHCILRLYEISQDNSAMGNSNTRLLGIQ